MAISSPLGWDTMMAAQKADSLIQPQFGFLAVSSAKPDNIFWKKFEETLFRWSIQTTFLQILSHVHLSFGENMSR
jgi:hypothetical protein